MQTLTGRLLRVDLTSGRFAVENIRPDWLHDYLGGRGLAARYLYEELDARVDPLSPANKLIFATGPLTGTPVPCGARYMVVTKGALTNAITTSNSGGHWGPELRFAGYDMVIVEGCSPRPVCLFIYDDRVELRDAQQHWGKTVGETEDGLRRELGIPGLRVACIGPGGEKQVRFACIVNDKHRAAGRSGVGAVMGSKNLKAIAVRGTGGVRVADPPAFMQAVRAMRTAMQDHPGRKAFTDLGTAATIDFTQALGGLPTRNFLAGQFEHYENLNGNTIKKTRMVANKAVGDLDAVIKANWLCNDLGLDPISMGASLAAAMELYERGVIGDGDVELPLRFGSAEALVRMVEATAYREGFGNELAEGSKRLGEKFLHPEVFMGVKGQEFPAYDPRAFQGMGVAFATCNRGACHLRAWTLDFETSGNRNPHTPVGKSEWVVHEQNRTTAHDNTGTCLFIGGSGGPLESLVPCTAAVRGVPYSVDDFVKVGERTWNIERLFNLEAGLTAADDTLPQRLLKDAHKSGPSAGVVVDLAAMLPVYYRERGWSEDGVPTREKLAELGLASA